MDLKRQAGKKGSAQPSPRIERLPRPDSPADAIAEADSETRRMMEEAEGEMSRGFVGLGDATRAGGVEEAEPAVVDIASTAAPRVNALDRLIENANRQEQKARRFEARLNLVAALLVALMIAALWFGMRGA